MSQIIPCPNGTVASYAGQTYSLGSPSLVLTFPPNWYSFEGNIPAIKPEDIAILLDPNGPNTLLISSLKWNLNKPNQHAKLTMNFTVAGATRTGGWAHGPAITQDATVTESTIVNSSPLARSDSYLNKSGELDQGPAGLFQAGTYGAAFVIELTSNSGTCSLRSYGAHFG